LSLHDIQSTLVGPVRDVPDNNLLEFSLILRHPSSPHINATVLRRGLINAGSKIMPEVTLSFDPEQARRAFEALRPIVESMEASEVVTPRVDLKQTAVFLLGIARTLREGEVEAALGVLPEEVWPAGMASEVEQVGWALWYADTEHKGSELGRSTRQLSLELLDEATTLRAQLLRVATYHLEDDAEAGGLLAAIRQGSGYTDLASDLSRLAGMFERWGDVLSQDQRFFDKDAIPRARQLAAAIVDALSAPATAASALRPGLFGMALDRYAHCQAAVGLVFRRSPGTLARFPSLFAAVRKAPTRRSSPPAAEG